jgi:hypothetical protein
MIRISCVAPSCGAMIMTGTRALTLAGVEEEERGRKGGGVLYYLYMLGGSTLL